MSFSREQLESYRDAGLPDLAGPEMRILLVGINPGLWSAAAGAPFARRGNRFYPALHRAGIVDRVIDASTGLPADDEAHLIERGVGITNIVDRATARADELTTAELRTGVEVLGEKVAAWRPAVVAVLGITAYRTAFREPKAALGRQNGELAGAELWAVPNPSGLNAHHQVDSLADWYRQAYAATGRHTFT